MTLEKMDILPLSSAQQVQDAFARFPTNVAGLAAEIDDELVGMVASTFTAGVSFDPPMALVSIRSDSATWERLRALGRLGVSVFGQDQGEIVMQLASRSRDRFEGRDVLRTPNGAYFADASLWLGVSLVQEVDAGDHVVVLLKIEGIGVNESASPLIYLNRQMRRLEAADRPSER